MQRMIRNGLAGIAAVIIGSTAGLAAGSDLVVLDWSGFDDEGFYQGYLEKHGTPPSYSFFGEEEEAFKKLRAGFAADVAHPCSQSISKWHEAGLLEPLQIDRIERWDDVNANMKEAFNFDGNYYMLPVDWGTTAIAYMPDRIQAEDVETLQIFLDPDYAQQISLPDNVDDVYALAFLATGVSDWTTASEDDFARASAWLRDAHRNVRTYWRDGAELSQLLASGEVSIAWAWNETPTTMRLDGVNVGYNRSPVEGSSTWFCGYVDLAGGPGDESLVYDFFNAWLEARSAEYIVNEWGYGHGNQAAVDALGSDVLDAAGLGAVSVPILFQSPMDNSLREKMIAEFELIKTGF